MKIQELKQYSDSRIAILWMGKEGKSTLDFLEKIWFKNITVLDKSISWENYLNNLSDFDLIFKTPGISFYNEKVHLHKDKIILHKEFHKKNRETIMILLKIFRAARANLLEISEEKSWQINVIFKNFPALRAPIC